MSTTDDSTTSYTPPGLPPQPPRERHTIRKVLIIAAGGFLAIMAAVIALAFALSGAAPHVTAARSAPPASAPAAPATSAPASTPASTPASLTGPLGTAFTVSGTDDSGNAFSYDVTAAKVLDPAAGAYLNGVQGWTPDAGKRFVGVEFTVTGATGYAKDDANTDAVIVGSDGQVYAYDGSEISAGTNFSYGDFSVTSGATETGWVTFQLPDGVRAASIQWQPDTFGAQQPATWTAGG